MSRKLWRAVLPIVAVLSACAPGGGATADAGGPRGGSGGGGGGSAGSVGSPGGTNGGGDGAAGETGGGDFPAVLAIFGAHCTTCHDATKRGLPAYPQMSLTPGDAYAALVGTPADETCGGVRVVAGDPASSYLMQKLTQDPPCDGARMPRPFEIGTAPPLTSAELAIISGWISGGAHP